MRVKIWLDASSTPIEHDAKAVFTKGGVVCIHEANRSIKYPLCRVHKIEHDYEVKENS